AGSSSRVDPGIRSAGCCWQRVSSTRSTHSLAGSRPPIGGRASSRPNRWRRCCSGASRCGACRPVFCRLSCCSSPTAVCRHLAGGVRVTVVTIDSILFAVPGLGVIGSDIPYPAAILFGVPWGLSLAALPLAAGFAILRYRLYDIDLLINRTLVYGALTLGVVA